MFFTLFVWNRERSDGASKIGEEDLHGSIVEFEKLWLLGLIRHWNVFQRERSERGTMDEKESNIYISS